MSFLQSLFSKNNDNTITPQEASERVATGKAVLIDVREADEWSETGVAEPALTLAMSALRGGDAAWTRALEANRDKDILVYCKSGGRSDRVASFLREQGFRSLNMGGFSDWANAGLPVRQV